MVGKVRPQSVVAAVSVATVAAVAIAGDADHDRPSAGLWAFAGLMTTGAVAAVFMLVWAERRQGRYRARLRGANEARRSYVDPETVAAERAADAARARAVLLEEELAAEARANAARKARRKPPKFIVLEDVRTVGSEVAR